MGGCGKGWLKGLLVLMQSQSITREISGLIEAVAVLICRVILHDHTARDDGLGEESLSYKSEKGTVTTRNSSFRPVARKMDP